MNKIVTYQSAEYYELLALGWVVIQQTSPSCVMMAKEGTTYSNPSGMPITNADTDRWLPYWGGLSAVLPATDPGSGGWIERASTVYAVQHGPFEAGDVVHLFEKIAGPQHGLVTITKGAVELYSHVYGTYAGAIIGYHARFGVGP